MILYLTLFNFCDYISIFFARNLLKKSVLRQTFLVR